MKQLSSHWIIGNLIIRSDKLDSILISEIFKLRSTSHSEIFRFIAIGETTYLLDVDNQIGLLMRTLRDSNN